MMPEGSFLRFRLEPRITSEAKRTGKKRRTKSGCLTCRTRRKKCDELKPACLGCRRNHLICKWPNTYATNTDEEEPCTDSSADDRKGQLIPAGADTESVALWTGSTTRVAVAGCTLPWKVSNLPLWYRVADNYLLDHYLYVTAHQLAGRDHFQNPFLEHLLPLAYQDVKVFEGLMAVSGAHLSSQAERFEHDARSHYAVTIRSVKHALLRWRELDSSALVALLVTTLLLCYFESIIGDTKGTIFYHLRASRTVLLELKSRGSHVVNTATLDFLTEWYAFLAIAANVTLNTDVTMNRDIPTDNFLSPDALSALNKGHASYGVLFGSAHKLLGLIVPISQTARRLSLKNRPEARLKEFQIFETLIRENGPEVLSANPSASDVGAAIYQQGLLVFLYTAFHGSSPPTQELYAQVDPCVDRMFELLRYIMPGSAVITTLMWPALIVGSCMRDPAQQVVYSACMESLPLKMGSCQRMREVLTHLWSAQAEDSRVYGPYGLEIIMRRKDLNICVS